MRKTELRTCWAALVAASALIAATTEAVRAGSPAADRETTSADGNPLIVHEWGTFTSFSGSDGVHLDFRPFVEQDLPGFVMTPARQLSSLLAKGSRYARQRMETPVLYFYSEEPRDINVRVDFPQGLVTEWYPPPKEYNQIGWVEPTIGSDVSLRDGFLDWGVVRLTPQHLFYNVKVRGDARKGAEPPAIPASLPAVDVGNHYAAARETDSAIVETLDNFNASHFEKFLFYRGLGDFEGPLRLSANGAGKFDVENTSADESGAVFLLSVGSDGVRFVRHEGVAGRSTVSLALPADLSSPEELKQALVDALVASGLYRKEARAMVKTWDSSWFSEPGDRALYVVPRSFVDRMLPLAIEPAPAELARVFVGRLETLSPERTERIAQAIATGDKGRAALDAELAALGRFAEPALELVSRQTSDDALRQSITELIQELKAPKADAQQLSDSQ